MRVTVVLWGIAVWLGLNASLSAQTWIQIEARPSLAEATARAQSFSQALDNVAGFQMRTGWFAVALGPFSTGEAAAELTRLRASAAIPADAYLVDAATYGLPFWPEGGPAANAALLVNSAEPDAPVLAQAAPAAAATPETPQQARRSERALDRVAREDIQRALSWVGVYTAGIDGDFGPGTRRAMSDWQASQGFGVTGVLTTDQRAQLLDGFRVDMDALGMEVVTDSVAGVSINLPARKVAFSEVSAPFSKYAGPDGTEVLLISQTGDRARLRSLYDVLQTLDVMPLEGPRNLARNSFTIEGRNAERASIAYAALSDGEIKGFVLVWPLTQSGSPTPVANAMRASLQSIGGVVIPEVSGADQSLDLLAGLSVRRPTRARSGFFVDGSGRVATSFDAVDQCARVTLGDDLEAQVALARADVGLAVLEPSSPQAPAAFATFRDGTGRLGSEVAVAGFSFGGRLGAPTLTFGTFADVRGLNGEEVLDRLTLEPQDSDTGGPVLARDGRVLGLLQPSPSAEGRVLPEDVRFSTDASALLAALNEAGLSPVSEGAGPDIPAEDLAGLAYDITVLVNCWN